MTEAEIYIGNTKRTTKCRVCNKSIKPFENHIVIGPLYLSGNVSDAHFHNDCMLPKIKEFINSIQWAKLTPEMMEETRKNLLKETK